MSRGVGWDLWKKKFAPIDTRVTSLEDTYVRAHWFESVGSGTSGTISAPVTGATFVLDQWSAGVDAIVSTISSGMPTFVSPVDSGGTIITATFDSAGAYVLSNTPTAYPVAVIFVYRCKFKYFDDTLSLFEAELEILRGPSSSTDNITGVSYIFIEGTWTRGRDHLLFSTHCITDRRFHYGCKL